MKLIPALAALGLAALISPSRAQTCDVAAGQTLINTDVWRICQGGYVEGLLHNRALAILDSKDMFVGYHARPDNTGGPGSGSLLTDGAFISRDHGLVNFGTVTITGPRSDGAQGSFLQYSGTLYSFGQFSNLGLFTNHGRAIFGGGWEGRSVLNNAGTLMNLGTLELATPSEFVIPYPGGGTSTWIPGDGAYLINSGEINNLPGASLLLESGYGRLDFTGGRLINQGYLRMRESVLQMGAANAGTLELRAQGTADLDTLEIKKGYLQLNAGTLIADRLAVSGALQNNGTMMVRSRASIDDYYQGGEVGLVNNGSLSIGGRIGAETFSATLYLFFQGRLENKGSLRIEAGSELINRSVLLSSGELINRGQISNQGGSFEISGGNFTLDGRMDNSLNGHVTFAAGSATAGTGHYYQSDGWTQLDGQVDIANFEIAGGRLCGSGFLNGNLLMSDGTLCPGNSPGSLHIGGDLIFTGGSLRLEVAGTAAGQYDVLEVDGTASFSSGVLLEVAFINGYVPQLGDHWSMLRTSGGASGLAGLAVKLTGLPDGYALAFDGSGAFTVQPSPVPEPGSWLLMLAGLSGLRGLTLRRKAGLAVLAVGGAFALPAQATCDDANRVVPIPTDFGNPRIRAGEVVPNLNAQGCHDLLPLIIEAGGRLDNYAGLSNQPGSDRGPNGRGGLFVNGLLDNKAGARISNLGEFYVDFLVGQGVGSVINDGAFTNQGLVELWGRFTTGSQGSFHHQSGSFRSGGEFISAGSFENSASVSLVGGSFSNSGLLTNRGHIAVSGFSTSLANAGLIDNQAGASLTIDAPFGVHDFTSGTLNNAGLFSLRSGLSLGTGGTVNMLAGSLIEGTPVVIFEGHTQVNAGRLRMNDSLTVWGSLQNDGVLDIHTEYATIGYPGGFASLANNQTITIGGYEGMTYFAGKLTNGASLVNNGQMRIEPGSRLVNGAVDVNFGQVHGHFQNNGQLVNAGAITNRGTVEISGTLTQDGTFENTGTVTFAAGSETTGQGSYLQLAGLTRLNGSVDIPVFEVRGGDLCGSGVLRGSLVFGGSKLCPGNSPGILYIVGDLDFQGGTLELEIAGPGAGEYDQLQVDGLASFISQASRIEIVFINGYVPQAGDQWVLLRFQNPGSGLANLAVKVSGAPAGLAFAFNDNGGFGVTAAPVSEPASVVLLLAGLAGLSLRRMRVRTG